MSNNMVFAANYIMIILTDSKEYFIADKDVKLQLWNLKMRGIICKE